MPEPRTEDTAYARVKQFLLVFLNTRTPVKWNNIEFTNISSFTSLLMCSLHCYEGYFMPSPPVTILSSLCLLKSPDSLPGVAWLDPRGAGCYSGDYKSSEFDSDSGLLMARILLPGAGSSCTFVFVFSVLYTKMHRGLHSLADAFDHLTVFFRSE